MYKVIKGFTSEKVSASKGKIIDIKDKKIANNLINAGVIESFSGKELSSLEKDKEIEFLKSEVVRLEEENSSLKNEKEQLESTLNELFENSQKDESDDNLENNIGQDISSNEDEQKNGEIVADPEKDKKSK